MRLRSAFTIVLALVAATAVAATVTGSLNVARGHVGLNADSSAVIDLVYTNASGNVRQTRVLYVDAACTRVIDQEGTVLANPAPTALCSAITSFASQLDTLIANAAAAGKLNP